jgi:GNAT superfamily N-acetyltransferase
MAADLELGRAGPENTDELLGLIGLVQPHVPWGREHLAWQFLRPPAGPARLYVARDAGKIVSLYVAVVQRVRTGDQLARGCMIQDVMTDPAYRGRGLLHRLGAECLAEMRAAGDVGYTFPNKLSEGSFRRLGWDELHRVPLRKRTLGEPIEAETIAASRPGDFSQRAGAIWRRANLGIGVERDAAFLAWRYSKPGAIYDCMVLGEDDGFLVTKQYRGATGLTMHVCDLVVADMRHVAPSLALVDKLARAAGASELTAWLPASHPYASAFDDAGLMLVADHDRYMFTTGPVLGSWHVTQGDSDVY